MSSVRHNYFLTVLLIIEALCFSLFLALYITAYALTGRSAATTLSEMLSENLTVQQLYLIFMGSYVFITLDICFLVWIYDTESLDRESHPEHTVPDKKPPPSWASHHRTMLYELTVYTFYVLSLLKLIGFLGLFWFDVNLHHAEHYTLAALGFISAVLCQWLLFFRRLVLYWHQWATGQTHEPPFPLWFFTLDLVFLLLVSAFLITFAATGNGVFEFLTGLGVVLDPLLLAVDFKRFPGHGEKHLISTSLKPQVKYQFPEAVSYPKQLYQRLLFYYNYKRV